ncbi:DMT family transporter [Paenibacillus sacheonensis]|uniref:EamA family transporter n=1 Tax=Paenibacillus sacheonensis TaxID=742054 RepID=A0A7X4YTT6_9BACL|nr:DMT family transporter [Paenibacillus sacheonensis]MBM7566814.1 drug/metabolite transporter (DMT)-like permease [Paenibacillus sacheonensis]NBC71436.1 EamA family transporter [Paenibacillus sacheonensis]
MSIAASSIALVLLSGFFHASWNLMTKSSADKNAFLWYCQLIPLVGFMPWAILNWQDASFTIESSLLLCASAVIHGCYCLLLAKSYTVGDLSQAYPIMRGTSPLLVPLLSVAWFHESLSFFGWVGLLLILAGIATINGLRLSASPAVTGYALAVGLCIAAYTLVDRQALAYVEPPLLNEMTNIGNFIALSFVAYRPAALRAEWRMNKRWIVAASVLAPSGYILFLYAQSGAPLAVLAPMREIGTVFGTVLAVAVLRERQGARRLLASVLITAGIFCIGFLHA